MQHISSQPAGGMFRARLLDGVDRTYAYRPRRWLSHLRRLRPRRGWGDSADGTATCGLTGCWPGLPR